jgi:CHAD domain-containing protein
MTTAPVPHEDGSISGSSKDSGQTFGTHLDDGFPLPTAGMVLHRVLARSARTFLLNDMGSELVEDTDRCETVDALTLRMGARPLWAQSAAAALEGTQRRKTETERIHQSRVALRRIRSNLRTFRLALDPAWGTSLRAELAWYGGRLGESRDLHIMREVVTDKGPEVMAPEEVAVLESVLDTRMAAAVTDVDSERGGARRFQLTEQMMVLWDGPAFKAKAGRPAHEVLPAMLHRAWHDLRGASRTARKDATDANLHKLRIRLKDLRYGCETVALVEGGPARKTAKAAERLQSKLGDLHDACFSILWLEDVARTERDLSEPIDRLVAVQKEAASAARKGWKRELKEIERRWRRWQG